MCSHTLFVVAHGKPSIWVLAVNRHSFYLAAELADASLGFLLLTTIFSSIFKLIAYFHSNEYNIRKGLTC